MTNLIFGRHAVFEALQTGRLNKILIARGSAGKFKVLRDTAKTKMVPVIEVERQKLNNLTKTTAHQGVAAYAASRCYVELNDLLESAKGQPPFFLMLAGWEDPRNFGAVLRTAEAAGVDGVIIRSRRAVPLNETVAKTSAGAIEYVKVARVTNLVQSLKQLKDAGFWVVGATSEVELLYHQCDFTVPLVLVVGSEGRGLGQLINKNCDRLVSLPMRGKISSLNATVAASILIYEVIRQRYS